MDCTRGDPWPRGSWLRKWHEDKFKVGRKLLKGAQSFGSIRAQCSAAGGKNSWARSWGRWTRGYILQLISTNWNKTLPLFTYSLKLLSCRSSTRSVAVDGTFILMLDNMWSWSQRRSWYLNFYSASVQYIKCINSRAYCLLWIKSHCHNVCRWPLILPVISQLLLTACVARGEAGCQSHNCKYTSEVM